MVALANSGSASQVIFVLLTKHLYEQELQKGFPGSN